MKEITLKEIAELLGIAPTTVSKALKDYPDVSEKTRREVRELAERLGYSPNSFAVNLRTKESKTIGLIIPEVVHHFFSNVITGIIEEAEKSGYLVIILQSGESPEMERKQVDLLLDKRVDGILMALTNDSNDDDHIRKIIKRDMPLVLFDKISKLLPCSKVLINDQKAAMQAVQHLIDIGCKKIAHIRGPLNPQNSIDRFLGYKKALEKNGLTFDPSLVYPCRNVTYEEGRAFAERIHKEHPDVDGIFCITDLVAVGVISYFNEHNIRIPQDVALIGFSNWFISQVITPKLSSIRQPDHEMGVEAARVLLKEINQRKHNIPVVPELIELETGLVIRESTIKKP
ncbi:LacI family DNA-binding transcriptional regulator [Flavobacterium sp. RNTU_13]|uniref:LacI family DNA-binding transcriptional regulator n=1 Tax=Flavobacterium sp. RNTU_13 TaxID=3375145 RepID=UPI00398624C5